MKVLMVNKFLHPNGGSETYIFKLGEQLKKMGHEVEFFGMEHPARCVGNSAGAYTSEMDFHKASAIQKISYSLRTIYSAEARRKIRLVLKTFSPDVVHLNNFNFQLTPSVILEVRSYEKKSGKKIKIVFTAHDYQLVCPNHMLKNLSTNQVCEKCLGGNYVSCLKHKCIHASAMKSAIGMLEAFYWKLRKTYREIDTIISPSHFLAGRIASNPHLKGRIITLHNFIDKPGEIKEPVVGDYVLYFGRYAEEKGIGSLLAAALCLPEIPFVFAGSGPLEEQVNQAANIENKGFLKQDEIYRLIAGAAFCVVPSEWYENCPFSVMESQMCLSPVLGADMGGIPELIEVGKTGELFEAGNVKQLSEKIKMLWNDKEKLAAYSENCRNVHFMSLEEYCLEMMNLYEK